MIKALAKFLGWLLILGGILGGIWVALVTCFMGGLLDIVLGIAVSAIELIVIGFCKAIFFWIPGLVVFFLGMFFGCVLLEWSE